MEIKGPGRITTPGVSRKGKKGGSGKAGFGKALSTDETAAAAPPSGTSPLTSVSSLLSLQEMPTSSEGRSKGLALAEDLMGHLEIIRHGLLVGHIPQARLRDVIRSFRGKNRYRMTRFWTRFWTIWNCGLRSSWQSLKCLGNRP